MALTRVNITGFGVLEPNGLTGYKSGKIKAQYLLNGTDFTSAAPAENGMWVLADGITESVKLPAVDSGNLYIVATEEARYNQFVQGLNSFALYGDYEAPKLVRLEPGDTYTSNTFSFVAGTDPGEYAAEAALMTALGNIATVPVYVVPAVNGAPRLTPTAGDAKVVGKVIKVYTLPNGDWGLKVEVIKNEA